MKIVAINGSPKGKTSNTNIMVSAFLKGASEEGAETSNIILAEKEINYCKGCYSCWFKTPGQCSTHDDMTEVLLHLSGASVIVLATPVYFINISGTLKVFMDRLAVIGSPKPLKDIKEGKQNDTSNEKQSPKLLMISNCGYDDRSQFQVVSLWIKRVAELLQMTLIGEIYAAQGKLLSNPSEELRPAIDNYLKLLEKAGKEIAVNLKLSKTTEKFLNNNIIEKVK